MNLDNLKDIEPWEWPEEAASLVLETLLNHDAPEESRLLAAEMAGNLVVLNEETGDALLNIVKSNDENSELRSMAAISLGPGLEEAYITEYDDPDESPAFSLEFVEKANAFLRDIYSDATVEKDVRRSVLEASVRNPQPWHKAAVEQAYCGDDPEWRLTAVFCMSFVKGFEKQILESLNNPDPHIHFSAIEAAGSWELDAAWQHIAALITSPKTEKLILLAAIAAAANIRPHEVELIEPLTDSDDEDIAEAAMDALMEAGFSDDWDLEFDDEDDDSEDLEEDFEDEDDEDELDPKK